MKRRTLMWVLLGASTLGIGLAIIQRNYSKWWAGAGSEDPKEAISKEMVKEFQAGASRPSLETMAKLKEIATGPSKSIVLPLADAWLDRMYQNNLKDAPEFHDLVQVLIDADPQSPQRAIANLRTPLQPAAKDYQMNLLVALGRPALTAVMAAFKEDALKAGDDYHLAAKSCFPEVAASLGPDALTELRSAAKSPEPAIRRQALRGLALMAIKTPERTIDALPDVEAALKDKEKSVRFFAVLAWGELKKSNSSAGPVLALLDDPDPLVRLAAARTLGRHAGVDLQAVARVVGALLKGDPFRDTWYDVVGIPSTYGAGRTDKRDPARQSWDVVGRPETLGAYAIWKGADKGDYTKLFWEETATHVLLGLGPNYRLPPETIVELLRSCPHDGRHLATMLAAQGPRGASVVPELAKMVKDPDAKQRRKALITLGRLGKTVAAEAMPDILAARDHRDGATRWQAFLALMQLDPAVVREKLPLSLQPAVHAAAATFSRTDLTSVSGWNRCLWENSAAILVPATNNLAEADLLGMYRTPIDMDLLTENDRIDQMLAVLDRSESLGKDTVPFLLDVWQGTGKDETAKIIAKVGDPAVPYLTRVFDDPQAVDLQIKVLGLLQRFGPKAKPAVPTLVKAISGPNEEVREKAAETIASLGGAGKEAVPGLRKLLKGDNAAVRRHAADALGLIGADAKPALPDLIAIFPDDNQALRLVAVRAASRIGKAAVEPLTKALENPSESTRFSAVQALGWLQDDAKPALPVLRKLAESDPSAQVKDEAREVVRKLEAK